MMNVQILRSSLICEILMKYSLAHLSSMNYQMRVLFWLPLEIERAVA